MVFGCFVNELNAVWQHEIHEPVDLGIGVNSGPAQVGNVGSTPGIGLAGLCAWIIGWEDGADAGDSEGTPSEGASS